MNFSKLTFAMDGTDPLPPIQKWIEANRPDFLPTWNKMMTLEAVDDDRAIALLIMASVGFGAGRQYEKEMK